LLATTTWTDRIFMNDDDTRAASSAQDRPPLAPYSPEATR